MRRSVRSGQRHGLASLVVLFVACGAAGATWTAAATLATGADGAPGDARFGALEREYVLDFLARNPVVATYLGGAALDPALEGIDGRLRDHSPAALAAEDRRLARFRARFLALDPSSLSARRRVDRDVAVAQIQFLLHAHGVRHVPQRALDTYVDEPFRGIDWQLQGLDPTGDGHYGTAADWARILERVRAIPDYLAHAEAQLLAGARAGRAPDWRVLRAYGLDSTAADREYFAVVLPRIANERIGTPDRGALLWDLTPAAARAAAAYARFRDFVVSTYFADSRLDAAAGLKPAYRADRFALGETEYDWALHNNLRVAAGAAGLYEAAPARIAQTRAAMAGLAREIARAHGWPVPAGDAAAVRAVFATLGRDAPRSDEEMLRWYRDAGARLVEYGRRTALFAVPADYRLDVSVTPPPLRASIEGAAYYPAPPFKASGTGRFYVSPTGDDPAELARNNRAALADRAAHEGFPGHDWYYRVMTQFRSGVSPVRWLTPGAVEDSASMWEDSMAAEGWALYAEALVAEPQPDAPAGFYTPEEHLYQLQGELLRELRLRIDTGLHARGLGFEAAVDLLSEGVDFIPGSCADPAALVDEAKRASCSAARRAVFRHSRCPTQAITYLLGRDQIEALRAEARRRLGPRFSLQRFHLEFMRQGTIPPGYFGPALLDALDAAPATDSPPPSP